MGTLSRLPEGLEHLRKRSTVLLLWKNDLEETFKQIPLRKEVLGKLAIHLEMKGLKEEGLFRISGSNKDTDALYQTFRNEIDQIQLDNLPIPVISGAMKLYLRSQPQCLIPLHLLRSFENAVKQEDDQAKVEAVVSVIHQIPAENIPILKILLKLFGKVTSNVEHTKMDAMNLAICFAPCLIGDKLAPLQEGSPVDIMAECQNTKVSADILAFMINNSIAIVDALPDSLQKYRIFGNPPPMDFRMQAILLTNASSDIYEKDQVILNQGDPNYSLFYVKTGTVRIVIGETVIREEIGQGELFGEMSFLGRFQTSASVIANVHNTEILSIKTSVLNSIFASDAELFFHFYWWMAENLANRLHSLSDLVFKKKQGLSNSSLLQSSDGASVAKKLITVSVETVLPGSEYPILRSISVDQKITVAEFISLCATRFTIPSHLHPAYNLFKIDDNGSASLLTDKSLPLLLNINCKSPDNIFVLSNETSVRKRKNNKTSFVNLQEYKCKLGKSSGTLYVSQRQFTHYSKFLGLEVKKDIPLSHIHNIVIEEQHKQITIVIIKKMKQVKLTFHSVSAAVEAYRVLLSIFKGTKEDQDLYAQDEFNFQRALVVCAHKADDWTELTLREGDILCVVTKNGQPVNNITHTMWLGECEGINGWFPVDCVELLDEPEVNKSLQQLGYKSLQDLPTKEDWEFLLLGLNVRSFNPGDVVLSPSDNFQQIYQLIEGTCSINTAEGNTVATLKENDTFGEISFLLGGSTSLFVVATTHVQVFILGATYLKRLFVSHPKLGGRFFKYLSVNLEQRLRYRESISF